MIEGLAFVAILRKDANIGVAWNQTIHQVGGYLVAVMVLENDAPLGPTTGQFDSELNLDFTESFLDRLDRRGTPVKAAWGSHSFRQP